MRCLESLRRSRRYEGFNAPSSTSLNLQVAPSSTRCHRTPPSGRNASVNTSRALRGSVLLLVARGDPCELARTRPETASSTAFPVTGRAGVPLTPISFALARLAQLATRQACKPRIRGKPRIRDAVTASTVSCHLWSLQ